MGFALARDEDQAFTPISRAKRIHQVTSPLRFSRWVTAPQLPKNAAMLDGA
jgi:hypothetical protein